MIQSGKSNLSFTHVCANAVVSFIQSFIHSLMSFHTSQVGLCSPPWSSLLSLECCAASSDNNESKDFDAYLKLHSYASQKHNLRTTKGGDASPHKGTHRYVCMSACVYVCMSV